MKRLVLAVVMVLGMFGFQAAWAGEMDVLVSKLVEKGILTPSEAQIVLDETKADVAKQNAKGANEAIPKWIQNTKLGGDFRLRYQYNHTNDSLNDRHRGRIRLRLGLDSKVNDKLMVGVGLATGLSSTATSASEQADAVRSTNASFDDSFAKKPIALDYAYAKYTPYPWVEFIGGKFKNPLWMPTDLVWDSDINPEGGSINLKKGLNSKLDLFLNTGIFVLDESNSAGRNDDPVMVALQPGFEYKATDKISVKGAVTYNNTTNVKGRSLYGTASSNSTVGASNLKYGFIVMEPAMQIDISEPFKSTGIPFLKDVGNFALFGQYVNNSGAQDENNGFAVGFNMGAKKVEAFGQWQFRYIYAMLEKDAVLDILPDSDRFGGKTGIRAHEGVLTYGLGKNTFLGIDIYRGWAITNSKSAETLVQVDWNLKF